MKTQLILLVSGGLVGLPLTGFADQDIQSRFDKSLKDVKSISNVEITWLDTLSISEPSTLKDLRVKEFSRTRQYFYIASGFKYHAVDQPISGTQTNLSGLSKSAYDGKSFVSFRVDNLYMTKRSKRPSVDSSEGAQNPLVAPFMFLAKKPDDFPIGVLRVSDITSDGFEKGLILPEGQSSNDLVEISVPGSPMGKQPTTWKITMDKTGDSFTPQKIVHLIPEAGNETVYRLLEYTNLGAYRFPARVEWTSSSYPPTSPPTLLSMGTITLISARIPEDIADSTFRLDNEEQSALTIWDADQKHFTKTDPKYLAMKAAVRAAPKIYDESADGAKQIAEALKIAQREHLHVMIQFGANWCGPCHELDNFLKADKSISEVLKNDYVIVLIDWDNVHNRAIDAKNGRITSGALPTIVILDAEGNQLVTEGGTYKLREEDGHLNSEKVLAFLKEWAKK